MSDKDYEHSLKKKSKKKKHKHRKEDFDLIESSEDWSDHSKKPREKNTSKHKRTSNDHEKDNKNCAISINLNESANNKSESFIDNIDKVNTSFEKHGNVLNLQISFVLKTDDVLTQTKEILNNLEIKSDSVHTSEKQGEEEVLKKHGKRKSKNICGLETKKQSKKKRTESLSTIDSDLNDTNVDLDPKELIHHVEKRKKSKRKTIDEPPNQVVEKEKKKKKKLKEMPESGNRKKKKKPKDPLVETILDEEKKLLYSHKEKKSKRKRKSVRSKSIVSAVDSDESVELIVNGTEIAHQKKEEAPIKSEQNKETKRTKSTKSEIIENMDVQEYNEESNFIEESDKEVKGKKRSMQDERSPVSNGIKRELNEVDPRTTGATAQQEERQEVSNAFCINTDTAQTEPEQPQNLATASRGWWGSLLKSERNSVLEHNTPTESNYHLTTTPINVKTESQPAVVKQELIHEAETIQQEQKVNVNLRNLSELVETFKQTELSTSNSQIASQNVDQIDGKDESSDDEYSSSERKEVWSNMSLRWEEKNILRYLKIKLAFTVPTLHYIESRVFKQPTASERQRIESLNLQVDDGPFTEDDDQKIRANFNYFSKRNRFSPKSFRPFVDKRYFKLFTKELRLNFVRCIGRSLTTRTLHSIYSRFCELHNKSQTRFSETDNEILINYMHYVKDEEEGYNIAAVMLSENVEQVRNHYQELRINGDYCQSKLYGPEYIDEILNYLVQLTFSRNIYDLRRKTIAPKVWTKIGELFDKPSRTLLLFWKNTLYSQLFLNKDVTDHRFQEQLIHFFTENRLYSWESINWKHVEHVFQGCDSNKLQQILLDLFTYYVPANLQNDFQGSLLYMKRHVYTERSIARILFRRL